MTKLSSSKSDVRKAIKKSPQAPAQSDNSLFVHLQACAARAGALTLQDTAAVAPPKAPKPR